MIEMLSSHLIQSEFIEALSNFVAGHPKAALLLWFFGDFRYGVTMSIRSDTVFADFQRRKMRQQEVARVILDL